MIRRFLDEFSTYSPGVKIALITVAGIWVLILVTLVVGAALLLERPGQALQPTPGVIAPTIGLEPVVGAPGATVDVRGEGWWPGQVVLIYLVPPGQSEAPSFATAGSTADDQGRFMARFVVPVDPEWQTPGLAMVIARAPDGASAQSPFSVMGTGVPSSVTPGTVVTPSVTPATPLAETPTAGPQTPTATAATDLNIRGGPGTEYAVLGILRAGQSAEITGVSPDARWWQIRFAGAPDERAWVAAQYVTAQNGGNVPVVQPPAPAPTSTPSPTPIPPATPPPVTITDWRGEYFNNTSLGGSPVLVRNDASINFDWGTGKPDGRVAEDNFSVRWTRSLSFAAGSYRFYASVDDGARLWIDNNLVIDQWHDSSPTRYSADVTLNEGVHQVRMEYYEHAGSAIAQLSWERLQNFPEWKGEYFNNRNLSGNPALVRNDQAINFDWGSNSPGAGIPVDNFSVRWTRDVTFAAGPYRFMVRADDGVRLWVDDKLIIDQWHDSAPTTYEANITLAEGSHRVRMEYFENSLNALAQLSWDRVQSFPDWKAEYFDNRSLNGTPVLVRNETEINHDWRSDSPAGVPANNFSARWTRQTSFQSGVYLFRARVDDGVRLWVDDALVLDSWRDGRSRLVEAEHSPGEGVHRVKVEYYERSGNAVIQVEWQLQQAANQPPQANPGGPYAVDEGSRVTLDGSGSRDADGSIVRYEWDFDYDGQNFTPDAEGVTASVGYPDGPATIQVALRVTDDRGATHLAATRVEVNNVAPTVDAGGPYAGEVREAIQFTGSASDPGSADDQALVYRWDFSDGTQDQGATVSHAYDQPGRYTVTLVATDKDGARGEDSVQVEVSAGNQQQPTPAPNEPPAAVIRGDTQGLVGQELRFNARRSSDPDGRIASYAWDLGDGATAQGVAVSHVYQAPGDYQVTVVVTDDQGATAQAMHPVRVEPLGPGALAPVAIISGPLDATPGQSLTFSARASNDADGQIVEYAWDLNGSVASGVDATHSFTQAGTYTVTLVIKDDSGLTGQATHPVSVQQLDAANRPPRAAIRRAANAGSATVQLDGSRSSDPDGQIAGYAWALGDGAVGTGITVTHAYSQAGRYVVTLTVTDAAGLRARTGQVLVVKEGTNQPSTNQPVAGSDMKEWLDNIVPW